MREIIEHFGINNQIRKFSEESFELIEALTKFENGREPNIKEVEEEIADCFVLLNQFIEYYEIDMKDLELTELAKTKRTLDRIKSGYYK